MTSVFSFIFISVREVEKVWNFEFQWSKYKRFTPSDNLIHKYTLKYLLRHTICTGLPSAPQCLCFHTFPLYLVLCCKTAELNFQHVNNGGQNLANVIQAYMLKARVNVSGQGQVTVSASGAIKVRLKRDSKSYMLILKSGYFNAAYIWAAKKAYCQLWHELWLIFLQ